MVTVRDSEPRDYSSLKAAIDAEETSITIDKTWGSDDAYTGSLVIVAGKPTTITVSGGAKHAGVPHSGTGDWWRLRKTDNGFSFTLSDDITVIGGDIENASTGNGDVVLLDNGGSAVVFTDSLLGFPTRTGAQLILYRGNTLSGSSITFTNVVMYSAAHSGLLFDGGDNASTTELNCCHVFDCGNSTDVGFAVNVRGQNQTIRTFNSLFNSGSGSAQPFGESDSASPTLVADRCITDQSDWTEGTWGSETVTDSLLSRTWTANASPGMGDFVIVEDISTAPFDLRLQDNATDNDAQDLHADSSGAGLTMPSGDIIGTSRPQGTNFDAGVFEVVVAAGGDVFIENRVSAIEQQQKPITALGLGGVLIQ